MTTCFAPLTVANTERLQEALGYLTDVRGVTSRLQAAGHEPARFIAGRGFRRKSEQSVAQW